MEYVTIYGGPMKDIGEPIQSHVPSPGLTPLELAQDVLSRIEQGNKYARLRKHRFRRSSSIVRLISLLLAATSTVILGLQDLDFWASTGFVLVALVTVVNTLEPFFAWRARWVLMEEVNSRFYRLRDELTFYLAETQPDQLDKVQIKAMFDQYQHTWDLLNERWLETRRSAG